MLQVGVVGYGYWGPNLVRNFVESQGCIVEAVCDLGENGWIWSGVVTQRFTQLLPSKTS